MNPPPKLLVVSLHDVSPVTLEAYRPLVEELRDLGVERTSLLVIPNHHSQKHFLDSPEFRAWIDELVAVGHEPVIHGYLHRRSRTGQENLGARITTRIYTADEGEFFDITADRARELVGQAQKEFNSCGWQPSGFIAPAWLLSPEAEGVLTELGLRYTTKLRNIVNLQTGRTMNSQSLVWSVRSAWRRICSLCWNRCLYSALRGNDLVRISIHPVDRRHPAIWSQIRALIGKALVTRTPLTYDSWIRQAG